MAIFWPVLCWQIGRVIRWMEDAGHMDLLFQICGRCGITVVYKGDEHPDPSDCRAYAPRRPRSQCCGTFHSSPAPAGACEDQKSHRVFPGKVRASGAGRRELCLQLQTCPRLRTLTSHAFGMVPPSRSRRTVRGNGITSG